MSHFEDMTVLSGGAMGKNSSKIAQMDARRAGTPLGLSPAARGNVGT
jgi:hypothetical protein